MPNQVDYRRAFATNFIASARDEGIPIRRTLLREFLQEDIDCECPYTIAGAALHYFCCDDGFDMLSIKAVLAFLEDVFDCQPSQHDLYTLRNRLLSPDRTREDLISWARGACPGPD